MCEIEVISRHIGRIGRRSFDRRMRMASPSYVERRGDMGRLPHGVDALIEQLHRDFNSISEKDYTVFGKELKIVIETLKTLQEESRGRKDMVSTYKLIRKEDDEIVALHYDYRNLAYAVEHEMEVR